MLTFIWELDNDVMILKSHLFTIPVNSLLESFLGGLLNICSAFLIKTLTQNYYHF